MRITPLDGLREFLDDVRGRGLIRIAHTKIDDVLPARPGCGLQFTDNVEDIGRQSLYALEVVIHRPLAPGFQRPGRTGRGGLTTQVQEFGPTRRPAYIPESSGLCWSQWPGYP